MTARETFVFASRAPSDAPTAAAAAAALMGASNAACSPSDEVSRGLSASDGLSTPKDSRAPSTASDVVGVVSATAAGRPGLVPLPETPSPSPPRPRPIALATRSTKCSNERTVRMPGVCVFWLPTPDAASFVSVSASSRFGLSRPRVVARACARLARVLACPLGLGRIGGPASFLSMFSCRTVLCSCSQKVDECSLEVSVFMIHWCVTRKKSATHAQDKPLAAFANASSPIWRTGRMSVDHETVMPRTRRNVLISARRTVR